MPASSSEQRVAAWLRDTVVTWESVDWGWVSGAAEKKFHVGPESLHRAYWFGFHQGWFERVLYKGDESVSLIPGTGKPVDILV